MSFIKKLLKIQRVVKDYRRELARRKGSDALSAASAGETRVKNYQDALQYCETLHLEYVLDGVEALLNGCAAQITEVGIQDIENISEENQAFLDRLSISFETDFNQFMAKLQTECAGTALSVLTQANDPGNQSCLHMIYPEADNRTFLTVFFPKVINVLTFNWSSPGGAATFATDLKLTIEKTPLDGYDDINDPDRSHLIIAGDSVLVVDDCITNSPRILYQLCQSLRTDYPEHYAKLKLHNVDIGTLYAEVELLCCESKTLRQAIKELMPALLLCGGGVTGNYGLLLAESQQRIGAVVGNFSDYMASLPSEDSALDSLRGEVVRLFESDRCVEAAVDSLGRILKNPVYHAILLRSPLLSLEERSQKEKQIRAKDAHTVERNGYEKTTNLPAIFFQEVIKFLAISDVFHLAEFLQSFNDRRAYDMIVSQQHIQTFIFQDDHAYVILLHLTPSQRDHLIKALMLYCLSGINVFAALKNLVRTLTFLPMFSLDNTLFESMKRSFVGLVKEFLRQPRLVEDAFQDLAFLISQMTNAQFQSVYSDIESDLVSVSTRWGLLSAVLSCLAAHPNEMSQFFCRIKSKITEMVMPSAQGRRYGLYSVLRYLSPGQRTEVLDLLSPRRITVLMLTELDVRVLKRLLTPEKYEEICCIFMTAREFSEALSVIDSLETCYRSCQFYLLQFSSYHPASIHWRFQCISKFALQDDKKNKIVDAYLDLISSYESVGYARMGGYYSPVDKVIAELLGYIADTVRRDRAYDLFSGCLVEFMRKDWFGSVSPSASSEEMLIKILDLISLDRCKKFCVAMKEAVLTWTPRNFIVFLNTVDVVTNVEEKREVLVQWLTPYLADCLIMHDYVKHGGILSSSSVVRVDVDLPAHEGFEALKDVLSGYFEKLFAVHEKLYAQEQAFFKSWNKWQGANDVKQLKLAYSVNQLFEVVEELGKRIRGNPDSREAFAKTLLDKKLKGEITDDELEVQINLWSFCHSNSLASVSVNGESFWNAASYARALRAQQQSVSSSLHGGGAASTSSAAAGVSESHSEHDARP